MERLPPPRDLEELRTRVAALEGRSLRELERTLDQTAGSLLRRKGKAGQTVERLLGASAGSLAAPDFVELGVELKTIPLDARGRPLESTFVCSLSLREVDDADWHSSSVRKKLAHVLFVPIVPSPEQPGERRLGRARFWRPTAEQESILRGDFDDLVGFIALGRIEQLTAHMGRWLQVRPKAAHGGVRTRAYGFDGEPIATIPRGFYLRARVTAALLADPRTLEP